MSGVTYDSGALIAAEANDRRMWLLHRRTLERGHLPTVPAGVLAQVWRGGPQPRLASFLAGCQPEDLTAARARRAGALLGTTHGHDVIDASVVAGAIARGDTVYSSDRGDLEALANATGQRLSLIDI